MPRVLESSTTREPLPEDKERAQQKQKQQRSSRVQPLDEVDKQRAEQNIQQRKEKKEKYLAEEKQKKQQDRRAIAEAKPIFNQNRNTQAYKDVIKLNRKEMFRKYVRPKFAISKKNQGYFQVVSQKRNRHENIRKAALADRDNAIAELKLMETEVLRNINIPTGIELDETDIFSTTDQITQNHLIDNVDLVSQKKVFDLLLEDGGPYQVQYTSSGRGVMLAGHGGHVAALKWNTFDLMHETETEQPIYAVQWMMDDSMYAVAQQLRTYVFNDKGIEIHSMHDFHKVRYLSYLPFHFLLVGATRDTNIIYKDISLGKNVANIQLDPTHCMTPNHYNAVMCLGHSNGQVSMVTPRDHNRKPVVSMFCHNGPVKHIAVDPTGQFMVTASMDNTAKVWDIRKTYQPLTTIHIPNNVSALTISQTGMTAVGYNDTVVVWKHATQMDKRAYLKHKLPIGVVRNLDFCPYEDVLGIGHTKGLSSILIPGSGQQNYDSRLPNPYSTDKQIKDYNVKSLLEKIPFDMITLNPTVIGTSGQLEKTQTYSENVEMTEDLKQELDKIGVYDKNERLTKRRKLTDSRDELREELFKKNEEFKASVPENWWEDKQPDALDRFATLQKRKVKNAEAEARLAQEDSDEEEGDGEEEEMDELERKEMAALKFLEDSDDEEERVKSAFQERKQLSDSEESDAEDDDEEGDANLLGDMADSDSSDEEEENHTQHTKSKAEISEDSSSSDSDEDSSSDSDSDSDDDGDIVDPFAE